MKLGRLFLKLAVVALGIFCAFMISACVQSSSNDNISTWEVSSCSPKNYGLGYTLNDDGESYSLSYVGKEEKKVVVPAEYNGKPVTKIARGAFIYSRFIFFKKYYGLTIEELTLPDTITEIADDAFMNEEFYAYYNKYSNGGWGKIGKLYYEGTLEQWLNINFGCAPYIGTELYIGGEIVEEITVPESITEIGANTFSGYDKLKKVNFHEGVVKIGDSAFYNCDGLTELDIPDSLTELGVSAFEDCNSLGKIDLSNTQLTVIPRRAFFGCNSLTTFVVSESVTQIGDLAFYGCEKLFEIYNLSNLKLSCGSEANGYVAYHAVAVHKSLDEPSVIVQAGDFTFYKGDNNWLVKYSGKGGEIELPENFEGENYDIYSDAFKYNGKITAVTIPDAVTVIGARAFYYCKNLTIVTLSKNLKVIGRFAFADCYAMETVEFPEGLEVIGEYAFSFSGVVSVVVPEGVTTIGKDAFYSCSELTEISLPKSLTNIETQAFYRCDKLKTINYAGTHEEWREIQRGNSWKYYYQTILVKASDEEFEV